MSEQIDTNELRKLEPVAWLIDSYHLSNLSLLFSDKQAAGNYANDFDTHQFDEPHETREAYEVDPVAIADELDALRAKVAKLTAERDALRELLDELSTTGAKSVAMVGTSGPGVTITTGLALSPCLNTSAPATP